jgi:RNA polymerase sigma-70 factor, ECF subfamily
MSYVGGVVASPAHYRFWGNRMDQAVTSSETYIQRVISAQSQLYAYVLTLLADTEAADDVLQETNLVLCRKATEFAEGTNFDAWAFRIARVQCLAYWKVRSRDRIVIDEAAINQIASRAEQRLAEADDRQRVLRKCLAELPAHQRELLEKRYAAGGSVKQLAERLGRPEPSLSQSLYRIRMALLNCVRTKLASEGASAI